MGTSTNLGPLTASPVLPQSCMQEYDTIYKLNTTPDGYYWLQGGVLETSCFPSGYAANTEQYYSPASCPSGFTAACQSENAIADVTETVEICCPTQFEYSCQSTSFYAWWDTLGCTNQVTESLSTTWTVVDISSGTTATRISAGLQGGLNAFSIQVRFQESDFASTTSSTAGFSAVTASIPSSGSSTSTSVNTNNNSGNGAESGVSSNTGAIVGIVIGAVAGLVLIIVAIVLFARRQRRNKNLALVPTQPMHEVIGDTPQQHIQYKYDQPPAPELHSTSAAVEMDATPTSEPWTQRRYEWN